jgi:hypothetical protein
MTADQFVYSATRALFSLCSQPSFSHRCLHPKSKFELHDVDLGCRWCDESPSSASSSVTVYLWWFAASSELSRHWFPWRFWSPSSVVSPFRRGGCLRFCFCSGSIYVFSREWWLAAFVVVEGGGLRDGGPTVGLAVLRLCLLLLVEGCACWICGFLSTSCLDVVVWWRVVSWSPWR